MLIDPPRTTYPSNLGVRSRKTSHLKPIYLTNELVEFEKNGWNPKPQENYPSFKKNLRNIPHIDKEKNQKCQHLTSWTWKH